MKRRDFLRNTGWFVVGASLVGVPACGDSKQTVNDAGPDAPGPGDATSDSGEPAGTYQFPQGVASGDPRQTSVVIWTRAVRATDATTGDVAVRVQVSIEATFATLIVDSKLMAPSAADHTLRVLVTGLTAGTTYYYRFTAGSDTVYGRTRTAPDATADVQVNLAWVSCQDYTAGHYGAYRQMIVDDDARPEANKIHAVVHLGDMIYETQADPFQTALDEEFRTIALKNRDGSPRAIPPFPSGGGTRGLTTFAKTVDDYRHLYKTFLSDPDIQAARARWPFICVWDDHEFTDDCWQSQANYTITSSTDETDQTRRVAASQAWFEYIPAQLTGAGGVAGVANEAKDFAPTTVTDAPFPLPNADNFVDEPNNVAAVGAITIYRSFRFGKHVELVMTDLRSYRSDHPVLEELVDAVGPPLFVAPRNVMPLPLVNTLDLGATAPNAAPTITLKPGVTLPNARFQSPVGTMLGKQQKAWWKNTMEKSDATWKLWGNEVTLMRLKIQQLGLDDVSDRVMAADSWDGYAAERNELMKHLSTKAIKNVVVLSGDIHAAFAGTVLEDFDASVSTPVACELVGPGVTSNSLFSFFEAATRTGPSAALRGVITVDASRNAGVNFTENLNMLLLHGFASAFAFAQAIATGADANAARENAIENFGAAVNPHLKYVDTNAQGYGYVKVTADQVEGTITTINRPIKTPSDAGPGYKRRAVFTIPKDNPAGMSRPVFSGTKPFPET